MSTAEILLLRRSDSKTPQGYLAYKAPPHRNQIYCHSHYLLCRPRVSWVDDPPKIAQANAYESAFRETIEATEMPASGKLGS